VPLTGSRLFTAPLRRDPRGSSGTRPLTRQRKCGRVLRSVRRDAGYGILKGDVAYELGGVREQFEAFALGGVDPVAEFGTPRSSGGQLKAPQMTSASCAVTTHCAATTKTGSTRSKPFVPKVARFPGGRRSGSRHRPSLRTRPGERRSDEGALLRRVHCQRGKPDVPTGARGPLASDTCSQALDQQMFQ
jgi:hypothetical protein